MISRQFKTILLLIFLFTTVLIVVLQYNANKNIDELVSGNENLLSEFGMKSRLQILQNDLLSIDNRVRSSIITNKTDKHNGIEEEVARVKASVKELGELLVTDSSRRLWDELNYLTEEKIRFSYKVLDTLSGSGKQAAEEFINAQKGVRLSEAIERVSMQLDNTRQTYLTQIIKETDANSLKAKRFGFVLAIMAITLVLFTFWYIITRIRRQQQLIAQLNESERKVREAAKVKEHFIANMSHEIRTPMNAILGFTNLLQKQALEKTSSHYVESIQSSSEKLLEIINDVLDLSKIEAGMMRIEKSPFSMRGLMHSVETMFLNKVQEKNIKLTCTVDEKIPDTLVGDAIRLTQVLVNLVSNAVKFTERGFIKVEASSGAFKDDIVWVKLTVTDSGIGIAEDQLSMIFERFTQAEENTTRRFGGTGLGLSIVQQIVGLCGGTIAVKSELQKGSSFIVDIPFETAKEQVLKNQPELLGSNQMPAINHLSVLVVEDNPMNQNLMEHLLSGWHINYTIAVNGMQAIEALKAKKYDLVLMDIQMPAMDGYTAAQLIRNELKSTVPIIAMTAHAFAGEREKCLSYGMNEYISKPVRENELYRMILHFAEYKKNLPSNNHSKTTIKASSPFQTIDLAYLHEISGGNNIFEKEILEQFMLQAPEELSELEHAYDQEDWRQLRSRAHNLKTTTSFLGLQPLLDQHLETLENFNESKENEQAITTSLDEVIFICNNALEEARAFLSAPA